MEGGGGWQVEPCICFALRMGNFCDFVKIELKLQIFVMTKVVSIRDSCFIKSVIFCREKKALFIIFRRMAQLAPPHTIRVKLSYLDMYCIPL